MIKKLPKRFALQWAFYWLIEILQILGVPGKLDHVAIACYEVGCMTPEPSTSRVGSQTSEYEYDMVVDYVPNPISDARRKGRP